PHRGGESHTSADGNVGEWRKPQNLPREYIKARPTNGSPSRSTNVCYMMGSGNAPRSKIAHKDASNSRDVRTRAGVRTHLGRHVNRRPNETWTKAFRLP